jgi:hypothetical protein
MSHQYEKLVYFIELNMVGGAPKGLRSKPRGRITTLMYLLPELRGS